MTDAQIVWTDAEREALEWHLASHFSGNRQPHMSGDPRARLNPGTKRRMDDAIGSVFEALAPFVAARAEAARLREALRECCTHLRDEWPHDTATLPRLEALAGDKP
jgi:hypothetical protein